MTTTTAGEGQIENLTQNLLPPDRGEDPLAPRMPFRTAYELTREQEDALVDHAIARIKQLEDQLGRNADQQSGEHGQKIIFDRERFLGKRELFTARFFNQVKDREEAGTIFEFSNITASLSQRQTAQQVAKANKFFFGPPDDDSWFVADPVGIEDAAVADAIKKHARWKVTQCGVKNALTQAVEFAFVRGESVVKVTHQERGQVYKRRATILVDEAGEPVLDANTDYIVQGDVFVDEMAVPEMPPEMAAAPMAEPGIGNDGGGAYPAEGMPVPMDQDPAYAEAMAAAMEPQPTGRQVLKRDGVTILPEVPMWSDQIITRRLVTFEGPEVALVYFKDFLCSESATDIQTTDFCCQLYDKSVMQVAEMFSGQFGEGDQAIRNMEAAVARIREMSGYGSGAKAAAGQPRGEHAEGETEQSPNNPLVEIAECYLTYDADGDGIQEEIMLILDRKAQAPIYYEYLANVTVKGRRPFEVIRTRAVDGRWYGMGSMEYFEPEQEFIDLELNRKNFADSGAGRVTLWRPYNTIEGQRDPNLKLHHGGTYTPKEGVKNEDVVGYIQLPHEGEHFMELLTKFEQYMMLKGGVVNGADQQASGLPTGNTATGINEVRDSGEELFAGILATLFPGVSDALKATIEVIYANMNRKEVFAYFNGPDAQEATTILSLSPEDVRDLTLNISLVLSRSQEKRVLETGAQADALFDKYYSRPLVLQERSRAFTQRQMKALRVPQVETLIDPIDPMLLMPPLPPGEASNGEQLPIGTESAPGMPMI